MPAIIFKDRYYHFFDPTVEGIFRYDVRKVQTEAGLLMLTSINNFSLLNKNEHIQANQNGPQQFYNPNALQPQQFGMPYMGMPVDVSPGFFIFDSVNSRLRLYKSSGAVLNIPYDAIKDLGPLTVFENTHITKLHSVCLSEEDLGIKAIYQHEAVSGSHGSFLTDFLKNSEGIPLAELMDHPYAHRQHLRGISRDFGPRNHMNRYPTNFDDNLMSGRGPGFAQRGLL